MNTADDFWARVDKSGECWIWLGRRDENGYGRIGFGRRPSVGAHRIAHELSIGSIPAGMCVCHRCDNPPCVNPKHLFLGSVTDNNRDRQDKGRTKTRFVNGEAHPSAKLNADLVIDIRRRIEAGEIPRIIAASLGVSRAQVSKIANRKAWSHVA